MTDRDYLWWVDRDAPPNGIGPVCRFCDNLIDFRDDHDENCLVRDAQPGTRGQRVNAAFLFEGEEDERDLAPGPPQLSFGEGEYVGDDLHFEVTIENVAVTDQVGAVLLAVTHNGKTWFVEGSSKRLAGDKPDPDLAYLLAMSRALLSLQRQFERQAEGRIKNNDWIRNERKRLTKKKAEEAAKK